MILSSHGIIGSSIGQFDPDALAFFQRVEDATGTLSATEKTAVNTLVVKMKFDGIWDSMKAIYPMVGASDAACKQNLKSSSFTGIFSSGWTFASTGATPNGTSAFMNTGFIPNGLITSTNAHLSFYHANSTLTVPDKLHGVLDGSTSFYIDLWGNTFTVSVIGTGASGTPTVLNNNSFFLVTAPSSTAKLFRANTQITTFTSAGAMPNRNFYFGAANENGTANYFQNARISFASLGDGLTDTQAGLFYTAVQNFNTTLLRQV